MTLMCTSGLKDMVVDSTFYCAPLNENITSVGMTKHYSFIPVFNCVSAPGEDEKVTESTEHRFFQR